MTLPLTLSRQQALEILRLADLPGEVTVRPIKEHNHLWRLEQPAGSVFLKSYTKDWYGDDVSRTAGCVDHEQAAYAILAAHGIPGPEVALACRDMSNPLGRPFILLRELAGTSLVPLLHQSEGREFQNLLEAAGGFLRRVHDITFRFPGYLMDVEGPAAPPDDLAWQHPIWTARQAQKSALAELAADRHRLSPALVGRLEHTFSTPAEDLAPAYQPPRFVHGDCHVGQFFLSDSSGHWQVNGFVDLEVASAGATEFDLLKFALEMMAEFSVQTRWWEPFFAGYGREPDLDRLRLVLLSASEASFKAYGAEKWPASREQTLKHVLEARDWPELFARPATPQNWE
jgi:Ser/Thr protein kinase RdoA (MazF antagonist)